MLVRVRGAALNRADLLQRRGLYPAPAGSPPDIPGLEFAGEVLRCGSLVRGWKPGVVITSAAITTCSGISMISKQMQIIIFRL